MRERSIYINIYYYIFYICIYGPVDTNADLSGRICKVGLTGRMRSNGSGLRTF